MAAAPVAQSAVTYRQGQHTRSVLGRCLACCPSICPSCGERTLHNISTGGETLREEVCENGCTSSTALLVRWQAEMKEALYQFERREARRRRKH